MLLKLANIKRQTSSVTGQTAADTEFIEGDLAVVHVCRVNAV